MNEWNSIEEIKAEFKIDSLELDESRIRDELKRIISSLHPDKNGGEFKTDKDKGTFLRAQGALEFLDSHRETALSMVPVSQLTAIVAAASRLLTTRSTLELSSLRTDYITESRRRISRRLMAPKIGSGVFAAITGALVAFPDKFAKNPLVAAWLGSRLGQLTLLDFTVFFGLTFVFIWIRERKAEAVSEYLISESALSRLFETIVSRAKYRDLKNVSSGNIVDAVDFVANRRNRGIFDYLSLSKNLIDLPTIEKAAALQTQRLLDRKLLTRIDVPSLDTLYELHAADVTGTHRDSF